MFSELLKTAESTGPCFCAFGARDEAIALNFNILGSKQGGKRFGRRVEWIWKIIVRTFGKFQVTPLSTIQILNNWGPRFEITSRLDLIRQQNNVLTRSQTSISSFFLPTRKAYMDC